jgi:dihydroflavonol-4-reductase
VLRDILLTRLSVRLMHIMSPLRHGTAVRELGWQPKPVHDSIRRPNFYRDRSRSARW